MDPESNSTGSPTEPNGQGRSPRDPELASRSSSTRFGEKPLWNNVITIVGAFLVIIAVLALLTFGLFNFVAPATNPYVDIVGYLVIPGILLIGLIIIPLGVLLKSWRLRRHDPQQKLVFRLPRVNLNDPAQRRAAKVVVVGTFIFLPAVAVSSYHGYHYTDSTEFCSQACHAVMEPEAVTFARSGHARVACAECHIGAGASWFVKSKLSGTRQVLAVMRNSYSRPIPPAIQELRPARETCEQCHWPEKSFGAQLAELARFAADESNTRQDIAMLLKTGSGPRSGRQAEGIHIHVALEGRIEYVAADEKLQDIVWVQFTDFDGREVVYRADGQPHSAPKPGGRTRHMDCMDCHNRAAHRLRAPSETVDLALAEGTIDPTLPYIKREAVAALVRPYPEPENVADDIANSIAAFYRTNYPEVWNNGESAIRESAKTITAIYERSFFPHMRVDWRTYPDNIGHKVSPGCFRCHDGGHVDEHGNRLSHACDGCHTFLNPMVIEEDESPVLREGEFIHIPPLEGRHANLRCDRCHSGGLAPQATCAGCHTAQANFRAGTLAGFEGPELPAEPMADLLECRDCHDLSKPTNVENIDRLCMDCHEDEPERFTGMLASWKREVDQMLADAEAQADAEDTGLLNALRKAGPLHNMEATRVILRAIGEDDASDSQ